MPALDIPEAETREKAGLATPWNVVVHNDPVNLMSYVALVFRKVLEFSKDKAQRHMLEVHEQGRSVVVRDSFEKAEYYVHALQKYSLTATLEPAS